MATDPFVAPTRSDAPRQKQNLAPGVAVPPARPWRLGRPGDPVDGPAGRQFGAPGPDLGFALALVARARPRFQLADRESAGDAAAVVAELAMRRAAAGGRAPVSTDVDVAAQVLGYLGGASEEFVTWRRRAVLDARHHYTSRRALVDAVPLEVLRLSGAALTARLPEARDALVAAAVH